MKQTWKTLALCAPVLAALALCTLSPAALAADPKHDGPERAGNTARGTNIADVGHGTGTGQGQNASGGHGGGEHHDPALIGGFNEGLIVSLTTLIVFALLLALLGKYAWGPIAAGLKAREDRIRKDIADAEAARVRAEAALKDYNTQLASAETRVREMLAKATTEGEAIAANIRTRAQQEAEETRQRAMRDIDAARDQAVAQIHEEAAVLATTVAEKILRRNLNPDDQRDLVAQSLDQLQTVGGGERSGNGRGRA